MAPVWLIVTVAYLALMFAALMHAKQEGERSDALGIGAIVGCFTLPALTIAYLLVVILMLALK